MLGRYISLLRLSYSVIIGKRDANPSPTQVGAISQKSGELMLNSQNSKTSNLKIVTFMRENYFFKECVSAP
jgi:hypothetical protein